MRDMLLKLFYSLNYRYCMANAYLADNRGDGVVRGEWLTRASGWEREYWKCGRKLV